MRLLGLDLLRFGPFTERSLRLRASAKLHVIYGPNEAGKTSAHAAVRDLLFGFDHVTSYDFLHRASDLRIGGELVGREGRSLAFIRRKGRQQTLLDAQGKALPDDALGPFLGHVSKEVFCRAFGLDAKGLREGAKDLFAAQGEAGGSLMAAASGLRGLTELKKALDAEAAQIYAPRAKQRRMNDINDRLKAAQDALREHELRADAWKKLQAELASGEADLDATVAQRKGVQARLSRLDRLRRLAPLLRRIDAETQASLELGDVPKVAADVPARLRAAVEALTTSESTAQTSLAAHAEAEEALRRIEVDASLLASSHRIEDLFRRSGACAKDEQDLPRVRAEADRFAADLGQLARRLGLDAEALAEQQPADQARARVQALAREGAEIDQRLHQARDALQREEDLLADRGPVTDPAPLRQRFEALRDLSGLLDRQARLGREIAQEARLLGEDAGGLYPAVPDLAALAARPLPADDVLARFRRDFDEIGERARRLRDERDAVDTLEREALRRLDDLAAGGDVPSAERIAAQRTARDAAYGRLRPVLTGEAPAPAPAAEIALFETSLRDADALADAAGRDAHRVAEHAAAERQRRQARERLAAISQAMGEVLAAKQALTGTWTALWLGHTSEPLQPAEMQLWSAGLRDLLRRHRALQGRREDLRRLAGEIAELQPALEALREACAVAAGLSAPATLRAIEEQISALGAAFEARRGTEARILRHRRDVDALEAAREAWTARWADVLPGLHLQAEATRDEALAALDVWKLVPAALAQHADRLRRVQGMARNIEAFEAEALVLVGEIAPALVHHRPRDAVERLNELLTTAHQQRARQIEAETRQATCGEAARQAVARRDRARATLAALRADLGSAREPAELLDLFARHRAHQDELAKLRAQLDEVGDGFDEAAIRGELAAFDADAAEGERTALLAEADQLDQRAREAHARCADARRRLAEAEGRTSAELANQHRRMAEAELQEAAREWAVLKAAGVLLDAALQRHRATRQDPLLQRAGALFAALTGGAYAGIDQTFGEADVLQLVARRADGATIPVTGLSEGTGDQFYLALRLAYVEDYASRADAPPFLADDLFASFDDRRTAHGLRVLADVGAQVQPILFTHHAHVADLARTALGAAVDVVELA